MKRPEFSKIILGTVMILYFTGALLGIASVASDTSLLGELLIYIGAPTATAVGFYSWKAKAENLLKISRSRDTKEKIADGAFRDDE